MILTKIEKLTAQARQASTEQQAREKFAAIHALCEVVLGEQKTEMQQPASVPTIPASLPNFTQPVAIPSQKLQEDDANGDSIFDF